MVASGSVVVDASVAVKWLLEEDDSDIAHALLRSWESQGVVYVAPCLIAFEVANALHRRVALGELPIRDCAHMIGTLLNSQLELHHAPGLHGAALRLANRLGQRASYDAHYLALADTLGCDLWTADRQFYRAARPTARNIRWIREHAAGGVGA